MNKNFKTAIFSRHISAITYLYALGQVDAKDIPNHNPYDTDRNNAILSF